MAYFEADSHHLSLVVSVWSEVALRQDFLANLICGSEEATVRHQKRTWTEVPRVWPVEMNSYTNMQYLLHLTTNISVICKMSSTLIL